MKMITKLYGSEPLVRLVRSESLHHLKSLITKTPNNCFVGLMMAGLIHEGCYTKYRSNTEGRFLESIARNLLFPLLECTFLITQIILRISHNGHPPSFLFTHYACGDQLTDPKFQLVGNYITENGTP